MGINHQGSRWLGRYRARFDGALGTMKKKLQPQQLTLNEFIQQELVKQNIASELRSPWYRRSRKPMSTMSPSFTTVPPEIRLMIFEYCLVVVGDIVPYPSDAEREDMAMNVRYKKPAVALLQVNRKIGEEARAVLYGKNTWHLSYQTYPPLQDTVWRINLPLFRHITTSFDYCDVTDFTISALYHGIERETYCALQSGDSSSRMAGNVQRQVTTAATGAMLHCCGYKLYIIDCMSLRSVTIDVEYLMHPTTYERARILRLVRMIPSNIWLTFGEGSGEAPVETPQLVDPNAIPAEATLLRWTGGWEGDAEILADMDG